MFSIEFVDDEFVEAEPGEKGRVGRLVLNSYQEQFIAHTLTWTEMEYLEQWTSALLRAVEGKASALVTDMLTPIQSSHLVWWPMWRIGEELVFQNRLFFFKQHKIEGPTLLLERLYEMIGEHTSIDREGNPLSEWRVTLLDVQGFIKRILV